ncbi:hypothetical protein M0804_000368 [Polistes exclamans]|nr:hypothetical protein M0804_000368 [Polistes exclamans]
MGRSGFHGPATTIPTGHLGDISFINIQLVIKGLWIHHVCRSRECRQSAGAGAVLVGGGGDDGGGGGGGGGGGTGSG